MGSTGAAIHGFFGSSGGVRALPASDSDFSPSPEIGARPRRKSAGSGAGGRGREPALVRRPRAAESCPQRSASLGFELGSKSRRVASIGLFREGEVLRGRGRGGPSGEGRGAELEHGLWGPDADGACGAVCIRESRRTIGGERGATGAEVAPEARFRKRGIKRAGTGGGYPARSEGRRPRRVPLVIKSDETGTGEGSAIKSEETRAGSAVFPAYPLPRLLRLEAPRNKTPHGPWCCERGESNLTEYEGRDRGTATDSRRSRRAARRTWR